MLHKKDVAEVKYLLDETQLMIIFVTKNLNEIKKEIAREQLVSYKDDNPD